MKRKRNVYYWVACEDFWFEFKNYRSNKKHCTTFKSALKTATGLKNRNPDKEVTIVKFFYKSGKRYVSEYVMR
jgi:hypothetical protein